MDDAVQKQDERDYILSHQSRRISRDMPLRGDKVKQGAAHLKIDVFVDAIGRTLLRRDERCVAFSDACGAKEEYVLIILRVACVADEGRPKGRTRRRFWLWDIRVFGCRNFDLNVDAAACFAYDAVVAFHLGFAEGLLQVSAWRDKPLRGIKVKQAAPCRYKGLCISRRFLRLWAAASLQQGI